MIIKVEGTITQALQPRQGVAQSGNAWYTQEFVVTDAREKKICFEVFGEEHSKRFAIGQQVSIDCVLESREWNGKFFTSVRYLAPKADAVQQPQVAQPTPQTQMPQQPQQQLNYAQSYVQPQPQSVQMPNNVRVDDSTLPF